MNEADAFLELARGRRSVRTFRPNPVPRATLDAILDAATWAPSPHNRQGWHFTVVSSATVKAAMVDVVRRRWDTIVGQCESEAVREELARYSGNFDWFASAPIVVVAAARRPDAFLAELLGEAAEAVAGSRAATAMAVQNLLLAAHAHGLGSCCLTGPIAAREELARLLELNRRQEIVCLVALGHPAETPPPPPRRSRSEMERHVE